MRKDGVGDSNSEPGSSETEEQSGLQPVREYQVGYGRPPLHTRFKPGCSGNPTGRPKSAKSLEAFVSKALDEPVMVQESGRRRSITKREAIAKQLVNKAASGDLRVWKMLNDMMTSDEWKEENPPNSELQRSDARKWIEERLNLLSARLEAERAREKQESAT